MEVETRKDYYILGIAGFAHDASACVLNGEGELLVFIEEERLNRIKHTCDFPILSIKECLDVAGLEIEDIDEVAFFSVPWRQVTENAKVFIQNFPSSLALLGGKAAGANEKSFISRVFNSSNIAGILKKSFPGHKIPPVKYFEHHLCHAASCYYPSGFKDAAVLTIDGRGESTTTLISEGRGGRLAKLKEAKTPHSLGHLYAAVTDYLGFKAFNDEFKVMGLGAYGENNYVEKFGEIIKFDPERLVVIDKSWISFHVRGQQKWLSDKFIEVFGPPRQSGEELLQRHMDLARALQVVTEEVGVQLAKRAREMTGKKRLCLAGGVVLNCLMNSKIIQEAGFEEVFIQPIANDAGASYGAALLANWKRGGAASPTFNIYRSRVFSESSVEKALKNLNINYRKSHNVCQETAKALSSGMVVSWFQGAMESGPRALGNRSILADPSRKDMKDTLNKKVKKREFFRPFAPSVLEERVFEFFDMPNNNLSPYMVLTGIVKKEKRALLSAITHRDHTARVQTVSKFSNKKYYELIQEFEKVSSIPVLLNTSFNENEPIVYRPEEAIECFLRTEIDCLVMEDFIAYKSDQI